MRISSLGSKKSAAHGRRRCSRRSGSRRNGWLHAKDGTGMGRRARYADGSCQVLQTSLGPACTLRCGLGVSMKICSLHGPVNFDEGQKSHEN